MESKRKYSQYKKAENGDIQNANIDTKNNNHCNNSYNNSNQGQVQGHSPNRIFIDLTNDNEKCLTGRYRRSANNIRESLPVINFSNSSNNSRVTETPSTSAGNIIEKGKNEEKSENSVKYYKISCPICLDNSTVSTRLDSHIFCHKCLSEALKYSNKKLCPLCRQPLVGNNAIHPIYMKV
ncbi:hypothetical protein U3516DRAFT_662232 [Neocallimastix sp. 'constans']